MKDFIFFFCLIGAVVLTIIGCIVVSSKGEPEVFVHMGDATLISADTLRRFGDDKQKYLLRFEGSDGVKYATHSDYVPSPYGIKVLTLLK